MNPFTAFLAPSTLRTIGIFQASEMIDRSSRFEKFSALFEELKVATGNRPDMLTKFDEITNEVRTAAYRLTDFLAESSLEADVFHGADKIIAHLPEQLENSWNEFKGVWEPRVNYLAMCDIDPDWPRDYEEHVKIYKGNGVIPDETDDKFIPAFHDGPAAVRQALNYLQTHHECRADLAALKYLVDTVGLDLVAVMERWQKVPLVFMPTHVAHQQQLSAFGPLTELFDDAVRAYVCGAPAAAFAMCRALLETIFKQSYLAGEFTEKDRVSLAELLARAGRRYRFVPIEELRRLIRIANAILHSSPAHCNERDILDFFKILKFLIQRAPNPL
jgi:hypothetical protein